MIIETVTIAYPSGLSKPITSMSLTHMFPYLRFLSSHDSHLKEAALTICSYLSTEHARKLCGH